MKLIKLITRWFLLWSIPMLMTAFVGFFAWQIAAPQVSNCWSIWISEAAPTISANSKTAATFKCMSPNEIGDFLAGSFAPLAFVWLAFAVVLQSLELSAQRKELEMTRGVAKEQQIALAEQARTMAETARLNGEQRARRDLDTLVEIIRPQLQSAAFYSSPNIRSMSNSEFLGLRARDAVARCTAILGGENPNRDPQVTTAILRDLKSSAYSELVAIRHDLGTYDVALYERYCFPELVRLLETVADKEDALL